MVLVQASRARFLILALLCAWSGVALTMAGGSEVSALHAGLVLLAATLAHASVNWLNEYDDFRSGLDAMTRRTPYSGGSGALPASPEAALRVLQAGWVALAGAVVIGGFFVWLRGWPLGFLGMVGIGLVVGYTRWITRHPWLCLLAPGLGFGPVMVLGGLLATGGAVDTGALLVAAFVGVWVNELLLINQLPDIEADRRVGRLHLPIALGPMIAVRVVQTLLLLAPALVLAGVVTGALPAWSGLALLPLPVSLWVAWQLPRRIADATRLAPLLGLNVATLLASLALMGVALVL